MFQKLILLIFPVTGICVSGLIVVFAYPLLSPFLLFAAVLIIRFLVKDKSGFIYRYSSARTLCFFILLIAIFVRILDPIFVYFAFFAFLLAGVFSLLMLYMKNRDFPRLLLECAGLLILIVFTFTGYNAFRGFARMAINTNVSCKDVSAKCEMISNEIDRPYDVFSHEGNLIVTAFKGIHFIDAHNRRTLKPEFERAVFSYYDPENHLLVGGGKGSYTAFIFDTVSNKFLFKKKIDKSDVIDVDYYKGKYYLLCESGNYIILDARDYSMKLERRFILGAYSLKINRKTGKIYVVSWVSGKVVKIDAETNKIERTRCLWSPLYKIAINERDNTILLSEPFRARIVELDGNTLETKRGIRAGSGVFDIQYSSETGRIYGASFFDGSYTESDYATGEIVKKYFVGDRARGVYYDEESGNKYIVSSCGVFKIR